MITSEPALSTYTDADIRINVVRIELRMLWEKCLLIWWGNAWVWITGKETLISRLEGLSRWGTSGLDSPGVQTTVPIRYWKHEIQWVPEMYIVPQSNDFYRTYKAYHVLARVDTGKAARNYFLEWNFRYILVFISAHLFTANSVSAYETLNGSRVSLHSRK